MSKVTFKKRELEKLISQFGAMDTSARVQVGVLGSGGRTDGQTNAQVGNYHEQALGAAAMEMGSISGRVPQRSFIKMPLENYLDDARTTNWFEAIQKRGLSGALKTLGLMGEKTIQRAFSTGGFGTWKKLSARTIRRKGSSAILIDTSQLRRSISSRLAA